MKYIFIRHGKTHFNEIGLKQGWCDSPLTKEGIQQIEKMTQLLKDEKITKAYTSPTPRAKQTAQIILKEHDVLLHEDERFKEVNFGVLEGLPCSFVDTLRLESTNWLEDLKLDYTSYQGEKKNKIYNNYNCSWIGSWSFMDIIRAKGRGNRRYICNTK